MKYSGLAMVYAYLIIDGAKEFSDVPKRLKKQVKEALTALGAEELAVEETTAYSIKQKEENGQMFLGLILRNTEGIQGVKYD